MKYLPGIRTSVALILSFLLIVAFSVVEYQHSQHTKYSHEQIVRSAKRELHVIRSNLEADIYSDIYYANSLATIISSNPQSTTSQWNDIAIELYSKSHHLKNLGVAPDDVIKFIYPVKGNEKALGLDFRTVPKQWETVKKARKMESIFVAGPVNLVQGGVGLIARTPIFTDPPLNLEYWGTCSVVLDMEELFRAAGVYEIDKRYDFSIRGKDGKGSQGEVFWGNPAVFESIYTSENVILPSGTWEMAVSISSLYEDIPFTEKFAARLIGYPIMLFFVLIFIAFYHLYKKTYSVSMHDEITRLPNHKYFTYTLSHMIDESRKRDSGFGLVKIHLNDVKPVDKTYGQTTGNNLLIEVAGRIKRELQPSDILARTERDTFFVILPRIVQEDSLKQIIINIHQSLCEKQVRLDSDKVDITVTIGHTAFQGKEVNVDELMLMTGKNMQTFND